MIFNVFALMFVLGITFMHSLFGLFSGIINVFCSIVALAVAFGYTEAINGLITKQANLHGVWVEPSAFVGLFVITLGVLRYLADQFLRRNVHVPAYVDWGGGAVCGFVNGQIAVGVLVLGFLMLPLGGRVGMFSRIERNPDNEVDPQTQRVEFQKNSLWLRSDEFAAGLANLLSANGLSSSTTLASVYPSYAEWVFWTGNTVQHESLTTPLRTEQVDGYESGIAVEQWWTQRTDITDRVVYRPDPPTRERAEPPYKPLNYEVMPGNKLLGVRLTLRNGVTDAGPKNAPGQHRFRPSMFRVVGDVGDEPAHFIPQIIGGADARLGDKLRIVDLDANFSFEGGDQKVDLYFEVPENFEPRFVEYRRHARAALTAPALAEAPPATRLSRGGGAAVAEAGGRGTAEARGAMRFVDTVIRQSTGAIDRLPFPMSPARLRREQVDLAGDQIESGRITADRNEVEAPEDTDAIETFLVPDGQRLFQVQTNTRQAAGLAGQVFNFVGGRLNQYWALSSTGDQYPLCGYYAIVDRDGNEFVELYYTPDPAGTGFRGMLDFQTDGIQRMLADQENARLGLLFLVPPGSTITGIKAGQGSIDFGNEGYRMPS